MEIRNAIMQMAEQDPQYAQAVDAMEAQVARMPIVPEDLDEAIKILEFVLQNPDKYEEVRAAAIADGDIDANMFPEQFDQVFIVSMLIAFYGLQDRLKTQGYARGGLAVAARRLQSAGRGGDTQLAHINDREAEMLRRMGGSGAINPNTGLHEYKGLKEIIATVAPIALAIFVPGLGAAIGGALGASGIGASILGGAIIGGASSALGGGDWKKGAIMGGLGGGLGGVAGKFVAPGATEFAQNVIGGGLVGGAAGALTGQGVVKGALQGVAGGAIGQLAGQNFGGPTAFEQGISAAGKSFGDAFTSGFDPKTAATMGVTSGVLRGLQVGTTKPSDAVVDSMKNGEAGPPKPGEIALPKTVTLPDGSVVPAPGSTGIDAQGRTGTNLLDPATGKMAFKVDAGSYQLNPQTNTVEWKAAEPGFFEKAFKGSPFESKAPTTTVDAKADTGSGMGMAGKALAGLSLISALQKPPPAAQEAIAKMSPEQQEYFNRPSVTWDWNKMQTDANASNMSLDQFMAANWPKITGYAQTQPGQVATQQGAYNIPLAPVGKARGGALSAVARFARGAGSGRADTIDAKLSDGEYVIDAETVAMLGDGSNQEGAKLLDAMRQNIRSHKGKTLAKGKISPNAKSPLAYLKGVA
jgi:hypothetical protein